jgi:hypothetical protein
MFVLHEQTGDMGAFVVPSATPIGCLALPSSLPTASLHESGFDGCWRSSPADVAKTESGCTARVQASVLRDIVAP